MPNWGREGTSGSSFSINWVRAMGGTFPSEEGTLDSVSIYVPRSDTSGEPRVAVYQGGSLDDPSGATLIEDLGRLPSGQPPGFLTLTSSSNPTLSADTVTWIVLKSNTSSWDVQASQNSADSEDFQSTRGRYESSALSVDPSTAYPDPWPTDSGSFGDFWYTFYLTYTASGGGGGGISVSLGTATFNLDAGASLGVNHELSPVVFNFAPQILQVAGGGLGVPLGTVTFDLSPQGLSWVRRRAIGTVSFAISPQKMTVGVVAYDVPHNIRVSRGVTRDPDSPSDYTSTGS